MRANEKTLTTEQAMKRLGISRGTFFSRVKEHEIKPANHNPNLKKQHNPVWRQEDIDKMGVVLNPDDDEEEHLNIAS